jgi:hypothetical protein
MPEKGLPRGTGAAGRELWRAVTEAFELEGHERQILLQAVVVADRISSLDDCVVRDGVLVEGHTHPSLVESRLQRVTLGRLLSILRLPDSEDRRPQHRPGFRGKPYRLRQVVGGDGDGA